MSLSHTQPLKSAMAETKQPLLRQEDNAIKPNIRVAQPAKDVDAQASASYGSVNDHLFQNRWTGVGDEWPRFSTLAGHHKSARRNISDDEYWPKMQAWSSSTWTEFWDVLLNGIIRTLCSKRVCRALCSAQFTLNSFVDISLIRASVDAQADRDTKQYHTLTLYNGGNNVSFRKCDRNTFEFILPNQEFTTSWLSLEVMDDKLLTSRDDFIGGATIDISNITKVRQTYYAQLPLVKRTKDDAPAQTDQRCISAASAAHLNITGILHLRARRNVELSEHKPFILEVEILAITNLRKLKFETGIDSRKFYFGALAFIAYLLSYALIMFVAELHTDTGMNEYKESIWFALVTITTIGYGDIVAQTTWSRIFNAVFITANVFIIAAFVGTLLTFIVEQGEESLNDRMDTKMTGNHSLLQQEEQRVSKMGQQKKFRLFSGRGRQADERQKRAQSVQLNSRDVSQLQARHHARTQSQPELKIPEEEEDKKEAKAVSELAEEEKDAGAQNAQNLQIITTKTTKLKMDELSKLDQQAMNKFKVQIWLTVILLVVTTLFGFFALGVALLLTGPNYLTALPFPGYDCDSDYNASYCALDKSAGTVFVDSLYFTIVSMSTVGYGDIYADSGPLARVFGAVFMLFGTMILVRFLDLATSFWTWRHNVELKRKTLTKVLSSDCFFQEFDVDGDGFVTKFEFLRGMLLKLDMVDVARIDEIMQIFYETDKNGDGTINREELRLKVEENALKLKWGNNAWTEINAAWKEIHLKEQTLQTQQKKLNAERKKFNEEKVRLQKENKAVRIADAAVNDIEMDIEVKEEDQEINR